MDEARALDGMGSALPLSSEAQIADVNRARAVELRARAKLWEALASAVGVVARVVAEELAADDRRPG